MNDWHDKLYGDGEEIASLRSRLQAEIREKEAMRDCIDALVSYIEAANKDAAQDGYTIGDSVLDYARSIWDWTNA